MTNLVQLLAKYSDLLITRLPGALLTLFLGWIFITLIQSVFGLVLQAAKVNKALQQILQPTLGAILWVGVVALVCQSLGLNQIAIALSGSIAIVGIGIASGANKLVSDVLAGLFLARNRDFKIGQHLKIGDVEGQIHSLDSRKVRLLASDGSLHVIPNTKFDEQSWQLLPTKHKKES